MKRPPWNGRAKLESLPGAQRSPAERFAAKRESLYECRFFEALRAPALSFGDNMPNQGMLSWLVEDKPIRNRLMLIFAMGGAQVYFLAFEYSGMSCLVLCQNFSLRNRSLDYARDKGPCVFPDFLIFLQCFLYRINSFLS